MRAVVQRVTSASVEVEGKCVGKIGKGLVILVGVKDSDTLQDVEWLSKKISNLRIFPDEDGKMSRSVVDERLEVLVISQFTLYCSCKSGRRPDCMEAAGKEKANELYEAFLRQIERDCGSYPQRGIFAASMAVSLVNDGPFTLIIDSFT